MNPLILGKGYVGNNLFCYLKNEYDLTTIVSKNELDYTNSKIISQFILDNKFDVIINCCGFTGSPNVDGCEANKEQCLYYNVSVPTLLNTVCQSINKKFINVTSGCIYTGYEKQFSEKDEPNFGIFNLKSSYYSFTKHLCERALANTNAISLRIRMPFNSQASPKNLIYKILKYNNIIDMPNSGTSIDDLCCFIQKLIIHPDLNKINGPLNVVNPGEVTGKMISEYLGFFNVYNPNWKVVDINELNIIAQRSNCVLSDKKIKKYNLQLPHITKSLKLAVEQFVKNYNVIQQSAS